MSTLTTVVECLSTRRYSFRVLEVRVPKRKCITYHLTRWHISRRKEKRLWGRGADGLGSWRPETTCGCRCCCETMYVSPDVLEVLQFFNYLCSPTVLPEVSAELVFLAILERKRKKLIKPCPVKETQQ